MTTVKQLRDAYKKACDDKMASFILDGHEFLTLYAKYLLEYLIMCKYSDSEEINFEPQ